MRVFLIAIFVLFLGAVGYGIYSRSNTGTTNSAPSSSQSISSANSPQFPVLPDVYTTPGQRSYYKNDQFGFVFEKPSGYAIEEYGVRSADPQVLLKGKDGSKAMLVWMYPVGSSVTQVTDSLVKKLDPSSTITSSVSNFNVAGVQGVSFTASGGTWDDGHQYWFIHSGILYKVYTASSFQDADSAVLSTWRFTR